MKSKSTWLRWGLGALLLSSACADDVPTVSDTGDSETGSTGDTSATTTPTIDPDSTGIDSNSGTGGSSGDTTEGPADTTMGEPSTGGSTGPGPVCGDDVADGTEDCDGTDLVGEDCITQGFDAGELACAGDCTFDTSGCMSFTCGNDVVEGMEACDGDDLAGEDCVTQGFDAGTLACAGDCTFDTSSCVTFMCGNDMIEGMEECDGADLAGETCITQGFDAGIIACAGDCTIDTSGCANFMCGNGMIEGMEACDGGDLGGETCITQGFDAGILGCTGGCAYDTAGCVTFTCGNDIIEGMEVCDGVDLAGEDCITQGFDAGALGCAGDCSGYDTAACTNFAGDCCAANGTPGCDDPGCTAAICGADAFCCNNQWDGICANAALAEPACVGVGGSCPGVPVCGNGVVDAGEACDGADLAGEDCITQGFAGGGVLACDAACGFDTAGCIPGGGVGTCCTANGTPGCEDPGCEAAVCAIDAFCCSNQWDGICANEAIAEPVCAGVSDCMGGGGVCGNGVAEAGEACDGADLAGEDCITQGFAGGGVLACDGACGFDTAGCIPGGGAGDCCLANGTPGCDDPVCEASICALDAFCCSNQWDNLCADAATGADGGGNECAVCAGGGVCGNGVAEAPEACDGADLAGEDCISQGFAGGGVLACDGACGFDTAGCIPGGGAGTCCTANGTPGCEDPGCEAAVCAIDAFCCSNQWDGVCANEAIAEPVCAGVSDCMGGGAVCGNGVLEAGEACDGADLGGEDCVTQGFAGGGVLACDGVCGFDTAGCIGGGGAGDCCAANGTPGCDDPGCEAAICGADPFCCSTEWDNICANAAIAEPACAGVGGSCP